MSLSETIVALSRSPLLSVMSEEQLRLLAFSAEARSLRQGQLLYSKDDFASYAAFVKSGSIGFFLSNGEDDSAAIEVAETGFLIDPYYMITRGRRAFRTSSLEDGTTVILLRQSDFTRVLEEYPELAQMLHARLSEDVIDTGRALNTISGLL